MSESTGGVRESIAGFQADEPQGQRDPQQYDDTSVKGVWADLGSTFGGVLLLLSAAFQLLHGTAAVANGDLYAGDSPYLYGFDMTWWGWTHIGVGLLSAIVAIGILRRASWGQVSGIIVAALSMIANFAFIPHYPLWSLVVMAVDALVIWALLTQLRDYQ